RQPSDDPGGCEKGRDTPQHDGNLVWKPLQCNRPEFLAGCGDQKDLLLHLTQPQVPVRQAVMTPARGLRPSLWRRGPHRVELKNHDAIKNGCHTPFKALLGRLCSHRLILHRGASPTAVPLATSQVEATVCKSFQSDMVC